MKNSHSSRTPLQQSIKNNKVGQVIQKFYQITHAIKARGWRQAYQGVFCTIFLIVRWYYSMLKHLMFQKPHLASIREVKYPKTCAKYCDFGQNMRRRGHKSQGLLAWEKSSGANKNAKCATFNAQRNKKARRLGFSFHSCYCKKRRAKQHRS